ncbi:MAG: alpha/beta hydrolase [Candidatus Caldarchaeum sp.]|uniref:Alpha/beta hydrolase n=1 Tax=Caldiarchaeum subterraneum TaxID=311458 RepID=A0A7C5LAX4_CALS0
MTSWTAHVENGSVAQVNGVHTFYVDVGRGDAVLLIHGWGSSSFSWRRNYRALSSFFRVIAVDLPGFGLSSRLPAGFHLDTVSTHLVSLMQKMDINRFCVVGHSSGGAIAAYIAARHADKVSKLVLVSPSLLGGRTGKRPFFVELARNKTVGKILVRVLVNRYFIKRALKNAYNDDSLVDGETVEGYFQSVVKSGPVLLEAFNIMEEFNSALMDQVKCDVLFVLGEKDSWVPVEENKSIAERIRARLVVVPGAGHVPHEEKPELVNNVIIEFLRDGS